MRLQCAIDILSGVMDILVESKYFVLWLKLNLALAKGHPVDNIIQEYEEMLGDQDEMNRSMEDIMTKFQESILSLQSLGQMS